MIEKMRRWALPAIAALFATLAVGCDGKDEDSAGKSGTDDTGQADPGDTGPADTTGDWSFEAEGPADAQAGDEVTYAVTVLDSTGADRSADAALSLVVSDPDGGTGNYEGASFTPTLAGDHAVTLGAEVEDLSFSQDFELSVAAGPAALVDLVLGATSAEVGETVGSEVRITDAWGNETKAETALSADPAEGATISGFEITFLADGSYEVTATLAEGSASDTEGPITVDSNGPFIALTSPERAAWLGEVSTVTVSGTITDAVSEPVAAQLDGDALTLEADGGFSVDVDVEDGLAVFSITAEDADGNSSDALLGVVVGETLAEDEALANSMRLRLNADALDVLGSAMSDELDEEQIEDELLASNPIAEEALSCFEVTVRATALSFGEVDVGLEPEEGALGIEIDVADLDIDLGMSIDLCGFGTVSDTGEITADLTTVTTEATITVPSVGDVEVSLADTEVSFTGLDPDMGDIDDLLNSYGYDWQDLGVDLDELMADAMTDAVEDALPAALEEALESVVISETFELSATEASLDAAIEDIEIDADGMTLVLESDIAGSSSHADIPESPGSWIQGGAAPEYADTPGLMHSLSLDSLNRLLHVVWDGGGLNESFDQDDLGLSSKTIGALFPGVTSLDVLLYPQLPPLVSPGTDVDPFDLDLGEFRMEAWGEAHESYELLAEGAMYLQAGVSVSLADDEISIAVEDGDISLDFFPEDASDVADSENLEAIISAFGGSLTSDMFPDIALPAPEISGFTVTTSDVYEDGADGTWLTVEGELE